MKVVKEGRDGSTGEPGELQLWKSASLAREMLALAPMLRGAVSVGADSGAGGFRSSGGALGMVYPRLAALPVTVHSSACQALRRAQRGLCCFMPPPCQVRKSSSPTSTILHTPNSKL